MQKGGKNLAISLQPRRLRCWHNSQPCTGAIGSNVKEIPPCSLKRNFPSRLESRLSTIHCPPLSTHEISEAVCPRWRNKRVRTGAVLHSRVLCTDLNDSTANGNILHEEIHSQLVMCQSTGRELLEESWVSPFDLHQKFALQPSNVGL